MYDFRLLQRKKNFESDINKKLLFYSKEDDEDNNEGKFGIEPIDCSPRGVAVLVNLNQGIGIKRSVNSEEELLRHIKLIEECTFE